MISTYRCGEVVALLSLLSALAAVPTASALGAEDSAAQAVPAAADIPTWQYETDWPLAEVPEPSGLCFCPARNTLFIVDDGGPGRPASLAEVDLEATVLQQQALGQDLEGVCWCPLDGLLYVADEAGERVHLVEPGGLKVVGECEIARDFNGTPLLQAGRNGIEGIEFIPDAAAPGGGYFLLLNQDDPHCIVRVDRAAFTGRTPGVPVPLADFWPLPDINSGELYFDASAEELWVVHSWMNLVELLDLETMQSLRWEVLPGCAQEAVALDGQGRLWIGSDTGGLARYLRQSKDM